MRSTYYPGVCTKPGVLMKQVLLYVCMYVHIRIMQFTPHTFSLHLGQQRLVSKTSRHGSLASLAEEGHHLTFNRYSSWDVPVRSSADLGGRGPHTRTPSPTFARTSTTSSHSSVGDSARTSTSSVAGKENKLVPVLRRSTSTDVMSQGLLKAVHLGDSAGRTSGLHVALSSNLRRQNSDLLDSVVAKGDVTPNPELLSRPSLSPDSSRPQSRSDRSSSEASFYLEGSVHVEDYPLNEGTTGSTVEGETVSALTKSGENHLHCCLQ